MGKGSVQVTTPCDYLIRADWCLTQDDERTIIEDAAIAVAEGRVLALGPWDEVAPGLDPAEILDMRPGLALPGLINAHCHAAMTVFRGLADDLPLMPWLTEHIWPVEARLTPEMVGMGARLACAEMLRTGTTCFADMYFLHAETARAVQDAGMRAVLCEGVLNFPTPSYATPEAAFAIVEQMLDVYADAELIDVGMAHHAVYTNTRELLERGRDLAAEHGLPWMIHLAETEHETRDCLDATGMRPLAWLDSLDCLGPRSVLVHCVDLDDTEIARLAETGANVAHCPQSNMKLANGFCPAQKMLDAGIAVALGTDGAASNNDLNMVAEMATAALVQKVHRADPTVLPAKDVLDMATRGGADALGRPDLGRLVPGNPADLVVMDLSQPNMQPVHSPVSQVVYAATGLETRLTMVAGRPAFLDGEYPVLKNSGLDRASLLEDARRARDWVRKNP